VKPPGCLITCIAMLSLLPLCAGFEVSDMNPNPGDYVVITGTAEPGQAVSFSSSFEMTIPTDSGEFEFVANDVEIPQKPNRFAVTANNVKDMNVGIKMGLWITKGFPASGGTAQVSQSNVPPGRYTLKVFGNALDQSSPVTIEIDAKTTVTADPGGKYKLTIDTTGIPAGDYKIEGAGDSKVIKIGGSSSGASVTSSGSSKSSKSSSSGGSSSSSSSTSRPVSRSVTPDAIRWYINSTGLNPDDPDAYSKAESGLKARLKGGYWVLIARGDPLTEQAGTCQESYCIVRGSGACTTCKDKDVLTSSAKETSSSSGQGANASAESVAVGNTSAENNVSANSASAAPGGREGERGLLEGILSAIRGIFSLFSK